MFGFGGKKYQDNVWRLLDQINARKLLPSMAPLNSEIMKYRHNNFSEHEAALLLCFSCALSIDLAGNHERAQTLYDRARDAQDGWIAAGFVNERDAIGFNKHIAANSSIRAR